MIFHVHYFHIKLIFKNLVFTQSANQKAHIIGSYLYSQGLVALLLVYYLHYYHYKELLHVANSMRNRINEVPYTYFSEFSMSHVTYRLPKVDNQICC